MFTDEAELIEDQHRAFYGAPRLSVRIFTLFDFERVLYINLKSVTLFIKKTTEKF